MIIAKKQRKVKEKAKDSIKNIAAPSRNEKTARSERVFSALCILLHFYKADKHRIEHEIFV